MARHSAPRGTEDFLPARVQLLDWIQGTCAAELERYGYQEIRTPLFEDTSLFKRAIGEVTDVVEKEMFTCERGDTSVTFRPEATAGVARSYLEHKLEKVRPFQKFFYIGPMFRFERPQAARQRQFTQIGVEAIGSHDPRLDAEVVHLAARLLDSLGLSGYRVCINTLGDKSDRAKYREALMDFIRPLLPQFCEECQARFERNVFRILDCKVRTCQQLVKDGIADEHTGEKPCTVFIAAIGDGERLSALVLSEELRQSGLVVDLDYENKSPKAQMRVAGKRGARVVLVIGESERARGVVQVKDMVGGEQQELPMDGDLHAEIHRILDAQTP